MNIPISQGAPFDFQAALGMRVFFSPLIPPTSPAERDWPVFKLSPNMGCSPEFTKAFDAWLATTFGLEKRRTVMVDEPLFYVMTDPAEGMVAGLWPQHYPAQAERKAIVTNPANRRIIASLSRANIDGRRPHDAA